MADEHGSRWCPEEPGDATNSGTPISSPPTDVGVEIGVDKDGNWTRNGEPIPPPEIEDLEQSS